jgi:glycosyltransferase involved in cell wall biosynthesis
VRVWLIRIVLVSEDGGASRSGGRTQGMFRDFTEDQALLERDATPSRLPERDWTVVIPFFNERDFLPDTLASLARQTVRFELVLVDNASTDGSAEVARAACARLGLYPTMLTERRRGKVAALEAGLAAVRTRRIATCDADTWYPADYLAQASMLLDRPGVVAAGAWFVAPGADGEARRKKARRTLTVSALLPAQCHTGGAGQLFDTAALRRAGGFSPERWNLVLEDHEVIHRVLKEGAMRYSAGLWCAPSKRERDRAPTSWTLGERVAYHLLVGHTGDWFFRDFLGPRLRRRKLSSERLRETVHLEESLHGPSYALC